MRNQSHLGTRSTPYSPMDVVLMFALALKFHGTADAIRETARRIRDRAPYEHRPKLKALSKLQSDAKVLACVWHMIDHSVALFGNPADKFPAPRCHMKPMLVDRHRWVCQHCKHVKERIL